MPSLALVAWGLILVYLDFRIEGVDVVPDGLGWVLVIIGLGPLVARSGWFEVARVGAWAGLAGYVADLASVAAPAAFVAAAADTIVAVAICTAVIAVVEDPQLQRRARLLRAWSLVMGLGALVLTPAGPKQVQVTGALTPLLLVVTVAFLVVLVAWILFLFRVARLDLPPVPAPIVA